VDLNAENNDCLWICIYEKQRRWDDAEDDAQSFCPVYIFIVSKEVVDEESSIDSYINMFDDTMLEKKE
jgi:hypothetical protein